MKVDCCVLFDQKVSVRVDGEEVDILPTRYNIALSDLERSIQKVANAVAEIVSDSIDLEEKLPCSRCDW